MRAGAGRFWDAEAYEPDCACAPDSGIRGAGRRLAPVHCQRGRWQADCLHRRCRALRP